MKKTQGGKAYYYLVESARVNGKPRIVNQTYIGPVEEVVARLERSGPGEPDRTAHRAFGDVAAVWSIIEALDVVGIVDGVMGPRRSDAAASVGTYVALIVLNRVIAPCSKLAFSEWWAATTGDRLVKVPTAGLDHRRFWDAMDQIDGSQLTEIERRLTTRMVDVFNIDLSGLALDMTNFATYIDSTNGAAPVAQRGHAKQKRNDLRLIGLGLVVSTDGGIPLVSHTYPGNKPDVTQFTTVVDELVARWGDLATHTGDLTVVYDAGQDSIANQTHLDRTALAHVGSLPPSDHPELLAIPTSTYRPVDTDRYPGLTHTRSIVTALGAKRHVIVTHSPTLHTKQATGLEQTLTKARRQLDELAARLARRKTRRTRNQVQADIDRFCSPRWVKECLTVTLTGTTPADMVLTHQPNQTGRTELEERIFGKRVLFTDRTDWPAADVVAAYRSQNSVEQDFKHMKNPHSVAFNPMWHWTDQKIRVHTFTCVIALTAARLLERTARQAGHPLSLQRLLGDLAGIQETTLLYQGDKGRPRARHMTTTMTPHQQRLYDLFNLDRYAPTKRLR
ncbi:MAG: IS1634 family transposase [Microthrixaceae bacterium]